MNFKLVAEKWVNWSVMQFAKADEFVSLNKAKKEIDELELELGCGDDRAALDEYADVFLCLFHSAKKKGFSVTQVLNAIHEKAEINYKREWRKNDDDTYSHITSEPAK